MERTMGNPELSIVIPVYNEEPGLPALFARLDPALDALRVAYEVIFVNDGSRDRSAALLREQFQRRPDVTRVVLFNANYGQHIAIIAGFERCRGERVVTLDATAIAVGDRQLLSSMTPARYSAACAASARLVWRRTASQREPGAERSRRSHDRPGCMWAHTVGDRRRGRREPGVSTFSGARLHLCDHPYR